MSDPSLGQPRKRRVKKSLATLLRERGVLSVPHAVEVALDICDALAAAHESGVVHGQLGLGCVRLAFTPDGGPREVEIFTLTSGADESGAIQAAAFVEPDRVGGAPRVVDARSDIWAIGALLYTMLVGKPPPAHGSVQLPDDSAPRSLATVIEACLSAEREDRPSSVDDLTEKIGSFATWPPDQFARLATRRERRVAAERVKEHRERLGLGNVPNVLDKLDDAALTRAQRESTAAMSSVLHTKTTEAALERLMTAVHEGTDAARIELAAGLPALVDFDDEDEVVLPTETTVDHDLTPLVPVTSPLAMPLVVPADLAPALLPAAAPVSTAPARPARRIVLSALVAIAIMLVAGYSGYVLSATASASAPTAAQPAAPTPSAAPSQTPSVPAIPVFSPSALPEAPPITPASLPEASAERAHRTRKNVP